MSGVARIVTADKTQDQQEMWRGNPVGGPLKSWVDVAVACLQGAAKLPQAACRGQAPLFDLTERDGRVTYTWRALALCRTCPVLAACTDWLSRQREGSVPGIVAGRVPSSYE